MINAEEYLKSIMVGDEAASGSPVNNYMNKIFFVPRFLGVHPYRKDFQKSQFWMCYNVVLVIIMLGLTVHGVISAEFVIGPHIRDPSSVFLRLCMERFQLCIITFSATYSIVEIVIHKNKLENITKSLAGVDKYMLQIGLTAQHTLVRDALTILARMTSIIIWGFLFVNAYANEISRELIIYISSILLPLLVIATAEFNHNALLYLVERRFDVLRARVDDLNTMSVTVTLSSKSELETMVKVYTMLVEISTKINDIYGRQILIIVATIFIIVTTSANFIIEDFITLVSQKKVDSYPEMLINTYVAVGRLFELWVIISACDGVVEKAKEFTASLYDLMIQDNSLVISKNKKLYLHISSHKEPLFTAYGFFSLDYSLFHSVIAAATTYLVILIQFSQKS